MVSKTNYTGLCQEDTGQQISGSSYHPYSELVRLSLGCYVQGKDHQLKKDVKNWVGPTTQARAWDTWLISHSLSASWLSLVYPINQSLWDLSLFTLEKRNLRGDLIAAYNCLMDSYEGNSSKLFSAVTDILTRSDSHKMPIGRFC